MGVPPPLSLGSGEASALVDIMAMLKEAPTEALQDILARLRGQSAPGCSAPRVARHLELGLPLPGRPLIRSQGHDPMQSGRANLLRSLLTAYFSKHVPEGVHKVEDLVARVVGGPPTMAGGAMVGGAIWTEEELFGKLEAKYGVPVDLDVATHNISEVSG